MNKEIRGVTGAIRDKIIRHHAAVDAAFSVYRQDMERAKKEAAKYKDEAAELKTRQQSAARACRAKIAEADNELVGVIKSYYQPKLREIVSEHIAERPPHGFLDLLRVYKDFDLPMTRGELDSLILQASGNYTALKALSSTAKKCGGWEVSAPSGDEYERQIAELNMIAEAPIQYCSNEFVTEGCRVYENTWYSRKDGSKYNSGAPMSSVHLILKAGQHKELLAQLEAMGEQWSATFVPEISSLKTVYTKNEDGESVTITPEEQHEQNLKDAAGQVEVRNTTAVQIAEKIGEQHRKAAQESRRVLEAYTKQ